MVTIIGAIIALAAAGISAGVSSSNASKQRAAQEAANAQNMTLNNMSLGIQQENSSTAKFTANQEANNASIQNMDKKISGTPLQDRLYEIWGGKA